MAAGRNGRGLGRSLQLDVWVERNETGTLEWKREMMDRRLVVDPPLWWLIWAMTHHDAAVGV